MTKRDDMLYFAQDSELLKSSYVMWEQKVYRLDSNGQVLIDTAYDGYSFGEDGALEDEGTVHIQIGDTTYEVTDGVASKHEHDEADHEAKAPTCTEIGWDAYVTCSRCSYTTISAKNALKHRYENGVCKNCGQPKPASQGLDFSLNSDEASYLVTKGSCKDNEIVIPSEYAGKPVTSIGKDAFGDCTRLTSITIPDSVTSVGYVTFEGCSGLRSVTIPASVSSIGYAAFRDCSSLTSITIGNGVTSISDYAFVGCSKLTSITIPDSVTSIGDEAFAACPDLTSINFTGTKAQWNAISKDISWDSYTGSYTVHCTDGDISKSNT